MYISTGEFTGSLETKLSWSRSVGATAGFTWIGAQRAADFTTRAGVPHHWLPFGVNAEQYGIFSGNFSDQPFDVGFTGSSGPKYPLRLGITRTLRAVPGLQTYFGSWNEGGSGSGGKAWSRLSRRDYIRQLARTKMWVSTTGPESIVGTRFFEVLASGTTLLLCNRMNQTYDELFQDGVHVIMFDGLEDLRCEPPLDANLSSKHAYVARASNSLWVRASAAKVLHYRNSPEARQQIVSAARSLVLEKHTWHSRASFVTMVVQEATKRHLQGVPWFQTPQARPGTRPNRSRWVGCFSYPPNNRPKAESGNRSLSGGFMKQKRTIKGPYPHGFNVTDCAQACRGRRFFGLLCGGFCRGDAHYRGDCYCGDAHALPTLRELKGCAKRRCDSTCSLSDERPCGGSRAMAVYALPKHRLRS